MSSFEWMELQTLASDIAVARSRLADARAGRDDRLVRVLELEISAAEARRSDLVAHITTHMAGDGDRLIGEGLAAGLGLPSIGAIQSADLPDSPIAELPEERVADEDAAPPEMTAAAVPADTVVAAPAAEVDSNEGEPIVWDQLTPQDLDRARDEIMMRREEMLARHAEELRGLNADRTQLEELEHAVAAFMRKFSGMAVGDASSSVVALDEERELRLQNRA